MFEWFDLSMRIKKKTILCGKVFVNFSYFLSLHESFSNNIFLFIVISILERSSSQFFFDFNPSIFVGITGLILNLKINFLLERIIRKSSSLRSKLIAIGYIICYRLYHLLQVVQSKQKDFANASFCEQQCCEPYHQPTAFLHFAHMEFISLIILQWKDYFDEDNGPWCFKSRFGHEVNSDSFHPSFVLPCKNRDNVASDYLLADDFKLPSYST